MKFTVPAGVFLDGLKSVHVRSKANSHELLKHIRFGLEGSRLTLLGHDQSSSSEAYLSVDGEQDGACAVPSDSVVKLVGSLPKEAHIQVERQEFNIIIKSGRSRYKLPVLVIDSFPEPLQCVDAVSVNLSTKDVQQLFDRPRVVIDPDDQRLQFQGCYLHLVDGHLASAAIGHYHFIRLSSEAKLPELIGVIIPVSGMEEIARLGPGKLSVSERTVAYEVEGRRFCSKLIDSTYIDYARSIPALGSHVEIDRLDMLAAVRRLAILTAKESDVQIDFSESELRLSIDGAGEGDETLQASNAIPGATVSISPGQIVDALSLPAGEAIHMHVEPGKQYIRMVDPSEPAALFLESTRIPRRARMAA
jgi:DNA polymerase-3 subunit beta